MHLLRKFLVLMVLALSGLVVSSQNLCPPNIDFEAGDFSGWVCDIRQGSNWLGGSAAVPGQHDIISRTNTSRDLYGNFPVSCPNGSRYSVKLGNDLSPNQDGGRQAQKISYTYSIPLAVTNFTIIYQYAVVFEDPTTHTPPQKPRFQAIVTNVTDNQTIGCVSFDFISGALPGFQLSGIQKSPGIPVYYKEWTPISLDLSDYPGKTIRLDFIVSDCTLGGHFGYCYVDVNSNCNGSIIGTTICRGDTVVSLTAPYGFQNYEWYSDITFSQVIGTQQVLTLSPAPNAGAIYPVIVTPFPGFGCVDTMYASLTLADKPPSNAGPDVTSCKYLYNQLGAPAVNPTYTYSWYPSFLVTTPDIPNPYGFITTYDTVLYELTTTDPATGCFRIDTAFIFPKKVDTSVNLIGKDTYCANDNITSRLVLNNAATNIQWYDGNNPVAGATSNPYLPNATGNYWARLTHNGCTDSTRTIPFKVNPYPAVSIQSPGDTGCVTKNSFAFANNTTISGGEPLSWLWTFGDGTSSTQPAPTKTYNTTGLYTVKMVAVSQSGCKDSSNLRILILPNVDAAFTWDSLCLNRPAIFRNLSRENGSTQVLYNWDFDNSITSLLKTPPLFNYPSAGIKNVSLTATAIGCESDVQKISNQVMVNYVKPGIQYPSVVVPYGYTRQIWARDSVGIKYNWQPFNYLSNSRIKAPVFKAVNDVTYNIIITNEHDCITVDTFAVKVLTKKGWYLPNAFTPNGDLLNDRIGPYLIGMKGLKKFSIYNRVGNLIFTTTQEGDFWDGTYKGEKMGTQAFVWVMEYYDAANKLVTEKGTLMLLR